MATKKTTQKAATAEKVEQPKVYYATESFYDSIGERLYQEGDEYKETSPERTEALLEAKVSKHNKIGRVFLSTKKPEGK